MPRRTGSSPAYVMAYLVPSNMSYDSAKSLNNTLDAIVLSVKNNIRVIWKLKNTILTKFI